MSAISSTFRQPESFRTFARVGSIIAMLGETKKPANTNAYGLSEFIYEYKKPTLQKTWYFVHDTFPTSILS